MKKITLLSSIIAIILVFSMSCNKEKEEETTTEDTLTASIISAGTCKGFKDGTPIGNDEACVEYTFDSQTNTLNIIHINAAFNCCPEEINAQFTFIGDTIIITESEAGGNCDCDCLYDLNMQIKNIEEKLWYIRIIEPLINDGDDLLWGYMNIANTPSGRFCTPRNGYPWGM